MLICASTLLGKEEGAEEIYGVNNTEKGWTVCRNLAAFNISNS